MFLVITINISRFVQYLEKKNKKIFLGILYKKFFQIQLGILTG